ncbi:RecQ family zinc-binding domain-containing protein [Bacteroidota bacterium]
MFSFLSIEGCRRDFISRYFGITKPEECGNCDLCLE